MLIAALGGICNCLHLTDGETKAQGFLSNSPKDTWLVSEDRDDSE